MKEFTHAEKRFWTVKELAKYLGVSKSLIYDSINKKRIPYRKIGSRILVPTSYVETFMTV